MSLPRPRLGPSPSLFRRFASKWCARLLPIWAGVLLSTSARAGGTQSFSVSGFDGLDEGEVTGAAIESSGRVTVGFVSERAEIKATTAFSCLSGPRSALVGTADHAAILRITAAPRRKRAKATFDVDRLASFDDGVVVSAMTFHPDGDILAATLPGGTIYRVSPKGTSKTFAKLDVDQVWAMAVHAGRILVATGPRGELWSLSAEGRDPKVVLDVEEQDLLSLQLVGNAVVVGTSPKARLYQLGDSVEGILLHEFVGDEVRALATIPGGLLAAVNDFKDHKLSGLDSLTRTLNRTSLVGQPPKGSTDAEDDAPSADAAIHHVDLGPALDVARASDAPWSTWLEERSEYFMALMPTDTGEVMVASSSDGKIYRVRGPREVATVADFEERQTTALCRIGSDGPRFATTAHGGAIYRIEAAPASRAEYVSEVFNAGQPARYGVLRVQGRGKLSVRARGGPTEEPDGRWTKWQKIPLAVSPRGLEGDLSNLPHRRFVQLAIDLDSPDAEFRSLRLFYAPENLPPLLTAVDFEPPDFDADDDDEPSAEATISWKVDARDDDDLVYDLRMRPEGTSDDDWIPLNPREPVTKKEFKLDLVTVPDGVYEVEVRASDEPSNGSAGALSDELRSAPFVVDRRRPTIQISETSGNRIVARVEDVGGYVHDVAYSIDAGPFRAATPVDGLLDENVEDVVVTLPAELPSGRHRVLLRARDSFGNLGTLAVFVQG